MKLNTNKKEKEMESKNFEIRDNTAKGGTDADIHYKKTGELVGHVSQEGKFVGFRSGYLSSNELKECRQLARKAQ